MFETEQSFDIATNKSQGSLGNRQKIEFAAEQASPDHYFKTAVKSKH